MAVAAGDYFYILQAIEGQRMSDLQWGTANAKQAVLRFSVASTNQSNKPLCVSIRNYPVTHSLVIPFTTTTSSWWTTYTAVIPPCTVGTWPNTNAIGMWLSIASHAGSTWATANASTWTAGNFLWSGTIPSHTIGPAYLLFTDVGLYADPYKTGVAPPLELPNIGSELRRCQRYWTKVHSSRGFATAATGAGRMAQQLPAPMRAVPSLAIVGTPKVNDATVSVAITAVPNNYCSLQVFEANMTVATGLTAGRGVNQFWDAETSYIAVNARM